MDSFHDRVLGLSVGSGFDMLFFVEDEFLAALFGRLRVAKFANLTLATGSVRKHQTDLPPV